MPIADVVILNLILIFDRTGDLKTFHKNAENHYKVYFPSLTNYENFMKASNKSAGFIIAFVQYQLYLNRIHCTDTKGWFSVLNCRVSALLTVHQSAFASASSKTQQNRKCLVCYEAELQSDLSQGKKRKRNVQTLLLQCICIFISFS